MLSTEQLQNLEVLIGAYEAFNKKDSTTVGYSITYGVNPSNLQEPNTSTKEITEAIKENLLWRILELTEPDCGCEDDFNPEELDNTPTEDSVEYLTTSEVQDVLMIYPRSNAKHIDWGEDQYVYFDRIVKKFYNEDEEDFTVEFDEYNEDDKWVLV